MERAEIPSTPQALLQGVLACPRCDRTLDAAQSGLLCAGCRIEFPLIGGVPWLFAEPQAALGEWRGRLDFALKRLDRDAAALDRSLTAPAPAPALRPATRARLESLSSATKSHRNKLAELLEPLDLGRLTAAVESHLALRTRLPPDQGLTTYYGNLHRDWCWGEEENAASLAIVAAGLEGRPERMLVLGAGGGRLAYDLHMQSGASLTVGLDFNPLLVLAAQRVARGERLDLYEFPLAPRSASPQAVLRTLTAPAAVRTGFELVLGDVQRPPFARGAFDVIVTPWLVDIVPERFDLLAARINRLLADGGRWLNFGSLSFHSAEPLERYGLEECLEALTETGFETPAPSEHEIPYLCSPASRHARRERVVSWAARKRRDAAKVPRYEALPDWIVRGSDAVPASESFRMQAAATRIHAFIMTLIDGRRSIKDMAAVLEEQRLMGREEAEAAIRSFLIKMYDDARRGATY